MLERYGINHTVLDANIEGLLYIMNRPSPAEAALDAWSRRAFRYRRYNLKAMRDPLLYSNRDRYSRAVKDIGRVLDRVSPPDIRLGLANYDDKGLSPLRSDDLLAAAQMPEKNPFYPYFRFRLHELFKENEPSIVGVSLNYLSQALCAFSIIGFIKRELPGVRIVLGGGLVTSWMRNSRWQNPFGGLIDHLVAGPGESALLALLGLSEPEERIARPSYGLFPRDKYLSPGFILPYSASTGCYWNRCSFCPEKAEGNPYLPLPAGRVTAELGELASETAPVLVHLLDNAISPALLKALTVGDVRCPWYGFARIGPSLADPDFCVSLRKSGCVMLKLGIESGDQDVLDSLQKGISVQTASAVLENLKKAGIATYIYLLFGTPADTESSAMKTLEFTAKHRHCIDFLNLAIFNMPVCGKEDYPFGTRDFYDGDLALYTDFNHPKGWDRKSVRLFLENVFKRHAAVSEILKNDPPSFTSNHAPFFVMERRKR